MYKINVEYQVTEHGNCVAELEVVTGDDGLGCDLFPGRRSQLRLGGRLTWERLEDDVNYRIQKIRDEIARRRALAESQPADYVVVI